MKAPENPSQIWIPHPKQKLVLQCPAHEVLYGGAAGAGKSLLLIFDWIQHHEMHKGHAKGLMIRRTYPELEDLIAELKKVFSGMQGAPKWMEAKRWFAYPDGSILEMGYLESYDDALRYQGRAFTWLGFDEITHLREPKGYEFLLTRMRSANRVPVRVVCTTNPGGPGHSWVMKRWQIDTNPAGMRPIIIETRFKDVQGDARIRKWFRIFIPGRLEDNPTLDIDGAYRANLMMKDERTRKMLLEGRWDVVDGAFFGEWEPSVHVVRSFRPPTHWKRWMGADWGTFSPCAFLWFCQSPNGEIFVYREIYGVKPDEDGSFIPNKGWGKTAREVAQLIRAREREAGEIITERYLDAHEFKKAGHENSIADEFAREGVFFQPSKKGARGGDRGSVNHLREFLKVTNGQARLRFMDCCIHTIRTFPQIQTDPSDPEVFDTKGEDHCLSGDTRIMTTDGLIPIRDFEAGWVLTPVGIRMAGPSFWMGNRPTVKVRLSNGHCFEATDDHRFLVAGKGFVKLNKLEAHDVLIHAEPDSAFASMSGVHGGALLPLRQVFPTEGEETPSRSLDSIERGRPRRLSRPPLKRGSGRQSPGESTIIEWARSLKPAYDPEQTGMGEGEHQESHLSGSSVAFQRGRSEVAPGARERQSDQGQEQNGPSAHEAVSVLDVHGDMSEQTGNLFLLGSLPYPGMDTRAYGVRIEAIEPSTHQPTYDIAVEDAHCFYIEGGVIAHNCIDACIYGLRRNIPDMSDEQRANRSRRSNLQRLQHFSGSGCH